MRRREIQAYLIGAAVAGTALVLPYAGRAIVSLAVPDLVATNVPFFLLPIAWGAWNVLWVRLDMPLPAPAWGALLGAGAAVAVNLLLWWRAQWFPAVAALFVWVPVAYALGWTFVIAPLNRALGAEPRRGP